MCLEVVVDVSEVSGGCVWSCCDMQENVIKS